MTENFIVLFFSQLCVGMRSKEKSAVWFNLDFSVLRGEEVGVGRQKKKKQRLECVKLFSLVDV